MPEVTWPAGYEPARAAVHVVNATQARAAPDRVWAWLVRPGRWPEYYVNARRVRHRDGPWPDVAEGSRFAWWTFGIPVTSVVTECRPGERLAWTWTGPGARGHHGFVLEARAWGTLVHTEETVQGMPTRAFGPVVRLVMHHFHQRWVEGLAERALTAEEVRLSPW